MQLDSKRRMDQIRMRFGTTRQTVTLPQVSGPTGQTRINSKRIQPTKTATMALSSSEARASTHSSKIRPTAINCLTAMTKAREREICGQRTALARSRASEFLTAGRSGEDHGIQTFRLWR